MNADDAGGGRWIEVTIPIRELIPRVGYWVLGTVFFLAIPYALVNGWTSLVPPPFSTDLLADLSVKILILLGVYVASVPVHEGLHALGMVMTGTPASSISFGAKLREGVVYIHCAEPMSLVAYRFTLLLPLVVTGVVPAIFGVATGSGWVTVYAALMIVSAIGDMEMVWRLRELPGKTLVRDHPHELGCEIQLVLDSGGGA